MTRIVSTVIVATAFLLGGAAQGQTTVALSGHWDGSLDTPQGSFAVQLDLTTNRNGDVTGTLSMPDQHIVAVPLVKVALKDRTVLLYARADQPFTGTVSDDGSTLSGFLVVRGFEIPLDLTRTGDAVVSTVAASPAVSKEFEGAWHGMLRAGGVAIQLEMALTNRPDGTVDASIVNITEGRLRFPLTVTQKGQAIEAVLKNGDVFAGELNAAGTEITGTVRQGESKTPIVFRRLTPNP